MNFDDADVPAGARTSDLSDGRIEIEIQADRGCAHHIVHRPDSSLSFDLRSLIWSRQWIMKINHVVVKASTS